MVVMPFDISDLHVNQDESKAINSAYHDISSISCMHRELQSSQDGLDIIATIFNRVFFTPPRTVSGCPKLQDVSI